MLDKQLNCCMILQLVVLPRIGFFAVVEPPLSCGVTVFCWVALLVLRSSLFLVICSRALNSFLSAQFCPYSRGTGKVASTPLKLCYKLNIISRSNYKNVFSVLYGFKISVSCECCAFDKRHFCFKHLIYTKKKKEIHAARIFSERKFLKCKV